MFNKTNSSDSKPAKKNIFRLFVGGLSYKVDNKMLRQNFENFGNIKKALVIRETKTRQSKGYGFITFTNKSSYGDALSSEIFIEGRKVDCHEVMTKSNLKAKTKQDQNLKIFVGGISQATTKEDLRTQFSKFGKLTEARILYDGNTGKSRGFGFVSFKERSSIDTLTDLKKEIKIRGKIIEWKEFEAKSVKKKKKKKKRNKKNKPSVPKEEPKEAEIEEVTKKVEVEVNLKVNKTPAKSGLMKKKTQEDITTEENSEVSSCKNSKENHGDSESQEITQNHQEPAERNENFNEPMFTLNSFSTANNSQREYINFRQPQLNRNHHPQNYNSQNHQFSQNQNSYQNSHPHPHYQRSNAFSHPYPASNGYPQNNSNQAYNQNSQGNGNYHNPQPYTARNNGYDWNRAPDYRPNSGWNQNCHSHAQWQYQPSHYQDQNQDFNRNSNYGSDQWQNVDQSLSKNGRIGSFGQKYQAENQFEQEQVPLIESSDPSSEGNSDEGTRSLNGSDSSQSKILENLKNCLSRNKKEYSPYF